MVSVFNPNRPPVLGVNVGGSGGSTIVPFDWRIYTGQEQSSTSAFATKGNIFIATRKISIDELHAFIKIAGVSGDLVLATLNVDNSIASVLERVPFSEQSANTQVSVRLTQPHEFNAGDKFLVAATRTNGTGTSNVGVGFYEATSGDYYPVYATLDGSYRRDEDTLLEGGDANTGPTTVFWMTWFSGFYE